MLALLPRGVPVRCRASSLPDVPPPHKPLHLPAHRRKQASRQAAQALPHRAQVRARGKRAAPTLHRRISGSISSIGHPFSLMEPFPRLQYATATAVRCDGTRAVRHTQ